MPSPPLFVGSNPGTGASPSKGCALTHPPTIWRAACLDPAPAPAASQNLRLGQKADESLYPLMAVRWVGAQRTVSAGTGAGGGAGAGGLAAQGLAYVKYRSRSAAVRVSCRPGEPASSSGVAAARIAGVEERTAGPPSKYRAHADRAVLRFRPAPNTMCGHLPPPSDMCYGRAVTPPLSQHCGVNLRLSREHRLAHACTLEALFDFFSKDRGGAAAGKCSVT